jgi:hypothetical protein
MGGISAANTKCYRIIDQIEIFLDPETRRSEKCRSQPSTQEIKKEMGKQKKRTLTIHLLTPSLPLRLPLQIPIKLRKPRPSLTPHPKPRKRPRQHTTKLLSMGESRAPRRDGTGLEAEEMVAVEEEGHASAPFELGGCVFLLSVALVGLFGGLVG